MLAKVILSKQRRKSPCSSAFPGALRTDSRRTSRTGITSRPSRMSRPGDLAMGRSTLQCLSTRASSIAGWARAPTSSRRRRTPSRTAAVRRSRSARKAPRPYAERTLSTACTPGPSPCACTTSAPSSATNVPRRGACASITSSAWRPSATATRPWTRRSSTLAGGSRRPLDCRVSPSPSTASATRRAGPSTSRRSRNHYEGRLSEACPDCRMRYERNPLRMLDCKRTRLRVPAAHRERAADGATPLRRLRRPLREGADVP